MSVIVSLLTSKKQILFFNHIKVMMSNKYSECLGAPSTDEGFAANFGSTSHCEEEKIKPVWKPSGNP